MVNIQKIFELPPPSKSLKELLLHKWLEGEFITLLFCRFLYGNNWATNLYPKKSSFSILKIHGISRLEVTTGDPTLRIQVCPFWKGLHLHSYSFRMALEPSSRNELGFSGQSALENNKWATVQKTWSPLRIPCIILVGSCSGILILVWWNNPQHKWVLYMLIAEKYHKPTSYIP